MKRSLTFFKLSALAFGLFLSVQSYAQQIKDVFVLVDQSGTMNNSKVNDEAKQIICDMITGDLSLSDWGSKGWQIVPAAGSFFNNQGSQMIKEGGKLCIIPFGNMDRVTKFSIASYTDNGSAQMFIKNNFPSSFADAYTYLNLAKAYAVHIAADNKIRGKVYMIIYTDGMGDYEKNNKYPTDLQKIIDTYGTDEMSSLCKKKGVLRKSSSSRNYDIEIWELGPIPQKEDIEVRTMSQTSSKLIITDPKKGEYSGDRIVWKKGEENTIKWKGSKGSVSVNIQRKDAEKYSNIPNKERPECYKVSVGSNSAKIKIFKNGDYRIIVGDSKGHDERYVSIKQEFPFFTIIILLLVITAGMFAYKVITKPKLPDSGDNSGHTSRRQDDWE